jgi:hypothetical protein
MLGVMRKPIRNRDSEQRERDLKYAEVLRSMIKSESEYTNHRTTWLLVAEGLLVAGVTNLLKEYPGPAIGLAIVGVLVALSYGHALQNNIDSRQYLKRLWNKRMKAHGYDIEDVLPVHGGYPHNRAKGWLLPDKFVPRLVICGWIAFIVYVYVTRLA